MKNVTDKTLLAKARETALDKVKNTMPAHNEPPDIHVARCWAEAFADVGFFKKRDDDLKEKLSIISDMTAGMAINYSKDIRRNDEKESNERMVCPDGVVNAGSYFGFVKGVETVLDLLRK